MSNHIAVSLQAITEIAMSGAKHYPALTTSSRDIYITTLRLTQADGQVVNVELSSLGAPPEVVSLRGLPVPVAHGPDEEAYAHIVHNLHRLPGDDINGDVLEAVLRARLRDVIGNMSQYSFEHLKTAAHKVLVDEAAQVAAQRRAVAQ